MGKIRTYSELIEIPKFIDRYKYLMLSGTVGEDTFGFDRYLNQRFYHSPEWRKVRNEVIVRDMGLDLGMEGRPIFGKVLVHHMNPVTARDIERRLDDLLNPEYLISVSLDTHNAIHYSDESILVLPDYVPRTPNDTCLWK